MRISQDSRRAATEIVKKYDRYLLAENMANQDEWSVTETIALIIEKHTGGTPAYLSEALNSGDGTYKP